MSRQLNDMSRWNIIFAECLDDSLSTAVILEAFVVNSRFLSHRAHETVKFVYANRTNLEAVFRLERLCL